MRFLGVFGFVLKQKGMFALPETAIAVVLNKLFGSFAAHEKFRG